jgi:hypothetical protein
MAHHSSFAYAAPVAAPPLAENRPPVANAKFLFEMILADLHWSSLQVATLCMMSAACAAPDAKFSLRSCRHIAYDDSRVMRLALRYSEDVGLGADFGQRLDRLYAELAGMQKQILPFLDPVNLSPAQRDQLHRLLPSMRKIASAAADALARLDTMTRARLHSNYVDDAVTIRQFLSRAAKGEIGEIDRFGVLTTPPIKQRRHSPRAPTNVACRLVHAQGEAEAAITDVSLHGLGLTCQAALQEEQAIAVLVGERRLEGQVARIQGRQIGLTLRKSLAFTDPLFQAG